MNYKQGAATSAQTPLNGESSLGKIIPFRVFQNLIWANNRPLHGEQAPLSPLHKIENLLYSPQELLTLCSQIISPRDAAKVHICVLALASKLKRAGAWPQEEFTKSLELLESKMFEGRKNFARDLRKEALSPSALSHPVSSQA
jgi:hypothetical protein